MVFTAYPASEYGCLSEETDSASETEDFVPLPITLTCLYNPKYSSLSPVDLRQQGRDLYMSVIVKDDPASFSYVEEVTRSQRHNSTWFAYRAGRITGSKIHDVLVRRENTPSLNLIKHIMDYQGGFTSKYTQWGIDHEKVALDQYCQAMSVFHEHVSMKDCGIVICS